MEQWKNCENHETTRVREGIPKVALAGRNCFECVHVRECVLVSVQGLKETVEPPELPGKLAL